MGFLENLKSKLEAEAIARQQHKDILKAAKQTEEEMQSQRAAKAEELSSARKKQAENFRQESCIVTLLTQLDGLIKQDLKRNIPYSEATSCGETGVFQRVDALPRASTDTFAGSGEWPSDHVVDDGFQSNTERRAFKILNEFRHGRERFDVDSTFDVAIWWDGEARVARDFSIPGKVNRVMHEYVKYFIVESNPEGDVVFHFKDKRSVSQSIWRGNKDTLEDMLGRAFEKPKAHVVEHQEWTHGPVTHIN